MAYIAVIQYFLKLVLPPILFDCFLNPNAKIDYTILGMVAEYQYSYQITYMVLYAKL